MHEPPKLQVFVEWPTLYKKCYPLRDTRPLREWPTLYVINWFYSVARGTKEHPRINRFYPVASLLHLNAQSDPYARTDEGKFSVSRALTFAPQISEG